MRFIRSVMLLACVAAPVSAQATTRPTTAVAGSVMRTAGADLVIDSLDLVLLPNPLGSAVVDGNGVKVTGLIMVARITNHGTERWAAPRAQGDANEANDRSRRVGRFDAGRDRLVARWEPLVVLSLPRGGTVEVAAPPRRP